MTEDKPKHIICFALPAWEAEYLRSTVELMKCASEQNLVLYVDYAYTITDCFKGILGKKKVDWKRMLGLKNRLQKINGNNERGLYLLTLPPIFPSFTFNKYSFFSASNKFNAAITGHFINKATKKLKMNQIIGFNSFQPFLGLYWKIKNVLFHIYYCYDDFTNVAYFKGFAKRVEAEFISKVDLLVVSSDELKKIKQQNNIPTEVVYNGVHYNAFHSHINQTPFSEITPITVGYTGSIDNRIDIEMLEPVIRDLTHIQFIFIGKIFENEIFQRLSKYKNVLFKPPIPSDEIPAIQSSIQIGIIPYVLNSLTKAIYPLKANEYLAMGLPVIMTPFASIGEADEVVYKAKNSEEFKQCIEKAIHEQNQDIINKRLNIAFNADWKFRTNILLDKIQFHYQQKINNTLQK